VEYGLSRFSALIVRVGPYTVGWTVWLLSCSIWNDEGIKLANGSRNHGDLINWIDLDPFVQYAIQKVCLVGTYPFNERIEALSSARITSVLLIRHT
jgi:hypothetical protein